jgi:hypothetical protein
VPFFGIGGNGRIGHVQITQEKKLAMFLYDTVTATSTLDSCRPDASSGLSFLKSWPATDSV